MAKKKHAEAPQKPEKEIEKFPVEINGNTYNLCFDFGALADAEIHFKKQGHKFNLLFSLCQQTLQGVRDSFPCLVHHFHPELSFGEAQELITVVSAYPVLIAIAGAFDRAGNGIAKPAQNLPAEQVAV